VPRAIPRPRSRRPAQPAAIERGRNLLRDTPGATTQRRWAAGPALEWLAVAAAAALLAWQLATPDPRIGDDDFQVFYRGAAAIAVGRSPYVGDFVSPPWFALALVPVTWLPLAAARAIWLALNVALLLLTTVACARFVGRRWPPPDEDAPARRERATAHRVGLQWPPRRLLLAALLLGLWPPVEFGLKLGQNSLLVYSLVLAALLAARARRFGRAGAILALALVKPQLVVLFAAGLAVLAARQRALPRYLAAAIAVVVALALAVLLVAPDAYADLLARRPRTWNYWGSTVALPPLLATLTGSQPLALTAYVPAAAAGSLALLRAWAREKPRALAYLAALTACATLLLTPYAYPYDAVLLQLPALWLVVRTSTCWRLGWRPWLALAAALCATWLLERPGDYTAWRFLGLLPPLGLLSTLVATRRALSYSGAATAHRRPQRRGARQCGNR